MHLYNFDKPLCPLDYNLFSPYPLNISLCISFVFRMILRKIMGPQFFIPIGKIKLECLHEVLLTVISNHPLATENWNLICTNNLNMSISFLTEFIDVTCSPLCNELGMFLETTMSILNRQDYRQILSKNFELFTNILDNLQLNPNNSVMCKCTVFKIPFASPFIIRCKTTTYYCFIEIVELSKSPIKLFDFINTNLQHSKFIFTTFIIELVSYTSVYVQCRLDGCDKVFTE